MANRVLSITISDASIKICELTNNKNILKVHKTVLIETPQGSYEDGYIRNAEDIGRAIKSAIKTSGMKGKSLAFSLYSTRIASRDVIVPYVKKNKIADLVNTNATEYFPVNVEDYLITYINKGEVVTEEGEKRLSLIVYAAPESMVVSYYELAEILGMPIVSVDYAGNSSAQLVCKQFGNLVTLAVHIDKEYSIVSIFKEGLLRIQRIVPYGKDLVVTAVKIARGVTEEEALAALAVERIIHSTFDGDEITESLKYLVNNINRIIDYYNTKYTEEPIEAAYLMGESVELLGMENLCSGEFRINVKQIANLVNVEVEKELLHSTVSKYALNIGAIINPCMFVPKTAAAKEKKKSSMHFIRLVFLLSMLVSVLFLVLPLPGYMDVKFKLSKVNKAIKNYEYVQDMVDDYYAYKDAYDDMEAFHNGAINNNDTLSKYIADMEAVMPSDMSFKIMNISDGSVSITGLTSSKESVARYILELKALPYTSNVVVSSMSEALTEDNIAAVTFSITYNITGYEEETTEETTEQEVE